MPILKVFSIYDKTAEAYGPLMNYSTAGLAVRAFETLVRDPNCNIAQFPKDFTLEELGTVDTDTGLLTSLSKPELISRAKEIVKTDEIKASLGSS